MTALRIGQRIKKVRGDYNIGVTGVVVDFSPLPLNELGGCDFRVRIDGPAMSEGRTVPAGTRCAGHTHQWEPITPDGHRAGDYSNVRDLMDALSQGVSA